MQNDARANVYLSYTYTLVSYFKLKIGVILIILYTVYYVDGYTKQQIKLGHWHKIFKQNKLTKNSVLQR